MIHPVLVEKVVDVFGQRLASPPELTLDALILRLENEVVMAVRFASRDEYSITWRWGEAEHVIDTAPCHPELTTFPNHFHGSDGQVLADPLTLPGREPWDNLRVVIDAVLRDPLLHTGSDAELA